ncbi:MAG: DUF1501 domain-containing protein [Planctomycetaceae bacterium]
MSTGVLGVGAAPCLADVLRAHANEVSSEAANDAFSVILFWANGGPSHLDLFDLKPDAPLDYRGPFRPIETRVPGLQISELLPQIAALGDKFSLVRSLHHERNQHSGATHRFLTGYPSVAANLSRSEFPDIGSVVSQRLQDRNQGIPVYVGNTPFYGGGAGYLGPGCEAYMPASNPLTASGNNSYDPVPIYQTSTRNNDLEISPQGVLTLRRRQNLRRTLDRLPERLDQSRVMSAVDVFHNRAFDVLSSGQARRAFDLTRERETTRRRYGDTHWGKSLLTCRRLVEAGVRFVQCQATFRLKPSTGRTSNWDDHSVNSDIFKAYAEKLPSFDQSVSAIVEDLYERGLDRRVLFVFCGEFGRTPLIRNQDPSRRPGRDHWADAMTIFVAGGGLQMGQVIGATSRRGEYPVKRIMDSNCLLATIYHKFGFDTSRSFRDNSGRPIPILTDGKPIAELL